jgi:uncharacterized protein
MKPSRSGLILRLLFFFGMELVGLRIFATLIYELFGYVPAGMLGTFLAAVVANAVVLRIWERGRLEDVGMGWNRETQRQLLLGIAGGAGAGLVVCVVPILARAATISWNPATGFRWDMLFTVTLGLVFGAVGEELLFRGYGFQVLVGVLGPWATILPFGVIFGLAHLGNVSVSPLGLLNTILWGILLGYAFWRGGNLWLPIGMHFGWNWVLPLFGQNLSGFTIGVTGLEMKWTADPLWSGGAYGPEASILTTLVVLAAGWWIHQLKLERQTIFLVHEEEEAEPDAVSGSGPDGGAGDGPAGPAA